MKKKVYLLVVDIPLIVFSYLIIKIWPMFKRFDVRLFSSFSLSMVVLYFLAMEYSESPDLTV